MSGRVPLMLGVGIDCRSDPFKIATNAGSATRMAAPHLLAALDSAHDDSRLMF